MNVSRPSCQLCTDEAEVWRIPVPLIMGMFFAAAIGAQPIDPASSQAGAFSTKPGEAFIYLAADHGADHEDIRIVDADVQGGEQHHVFPTLYDDGSNGDIIAGDGVYSILATLPGPPGERTVMFFVVDGSGEEHALAPVRFMLR